MDTLGFNDFSLKCKVGFNKQNDIHRHCKKYMVTLMFIFVMTRDDMD